MIEIDIDDLMHNHLIIKSVIHMIEIDSDDLMHNHQMKPAIYMIEI